MYCFRQPAVRTVQAYGRKLDARLLTHVTGWSSAAVFTGPFQAFSCFVRIPDKLWLEVYTRFIQRLALLYIANNAHTALLKIHGSPATVTQYPQTPCKGLQVPSPIFLATQVSILQLSPASNSQPMPHTVLNWQAIYNLLVFFSIDMSLAIPESKRASKARATNKA